MAKTYRIVLRSDGKYRVDKHRMFFGWDKNICEGKLTYPDMRVYRSYFPRLFDEFVDADRYVESLRKTPSIRKITDCKIMKTVTI